MRRGTVVHGRYEIREQIGKGGSGEVYLVRDRNLNCAWAMKAVPGESGGLTNGRMAADAEVLKRLTHPNLPRIIDAFEESGTLFTVMDYIAGETLKDHVEEYGAFSQNEVIRFGIALADVLNCLHSMNPPIIYRDMKPGNIMLRRNGEIVLCDFGIAREYKESSSADTICLGTVGYAAPEQYGGGQSDERTDIYGLGATLYHLVTGADPAEPPYGIVPIRQVRPSLSGGLEKIIEKATSRDPSDRFMNCAEMKRALERCHELDDSCLKRERRKAAVFLSTVACSVILTGSTVFFGYRTIESRKADYSFCMAEAGEMAAKSLSEGRFDAEVMRRFSEAIDLAPKREEAYLGILDYCEAAGAGSSGAALISARVDTSEHFSSDEVLMRLADLYASSSPGESDYYTKMRRAARYYSMVDESVCPEAAELAKIMTTLSAFGSEINWTSLAETLMEFAVRMQNGGPGRRNVRNMILAAEICSMNESAFAASGVEIENLAEALYEQASEDARILAERGADAGTLLARAESGLRTLREKKHGTSAAVNMTYRMTGDTGREGGSFE